MTSPPLLAPRSAPCSNAGWLRVPRTTARTCGAAADSSYFLDFHQLQVLTKALGLWHAAAPHGDRLIGNSLPEVQSWHACMHNKEEACMQSATSMPVALDGVQRVQDDDIPL